MALTEKDIIEAKIRVGREFNLSQGNYFERVVYEMRPNAKPETRRTIAHDGDMDTLNYIHNEAFQTREPAIHLKHEG